MPPVRGLAPGGLCLNITFYYIVIHGRIGYVKEREREREEKEKGFLYAFEHGCGNPDMHCTRSSINHESPKETSGCLLDRLQMSVRMAESVRMSPRLLI